jgi:transcriptional antiterminator RfaH
MRVLDFLSSRMRAARLCMGYVNTHILRRNYGGEETPCVAPRLVSHCAAGVPETPDGWIDGQMSFWAVLTVINSLDRGRRAERGLERLGFEFYNPKIQERWVRQGQSILREVAFFPGYMFVRIYEEWSKLHTIVDVTGILKDMTGPLKVSEHLIQSVRLMEKDLYHPPKQQVRFAQGERVQLLNSAGPYAGKVGLFNGMDGQGRCAVLLNLLGKQVPILVPEIALTEARTA